MFWHNFKYSIKTLARNKMLLFWTFAFPIILGTLFSMAFSGVENGEKLDIINIAIVESEYFTDDEIFNETFKNLSDENNESRLFNITYTDLDNSKQMLEDEKIVGYLEFKENDVDITVKSSGVNETILKLVVDEVISQKKMIETLITKEVENAISNGNFNVDYDQIYNNVINVIASSEANLNNISSDNLSYIMIEFYTLIAMAALYGGVISMFITNYKLANMSAVGKKTSITPIHKGSMLLGSLLASYFVQLIGIGLLFLYTIFVLNVDYGSNLLLVILLALVGSLAGLALGVFVATIFKTNENTKMGILIAFTMLCSFLSGMMGITMKYVVDKNIPILNIINPASMITDGFYSLYYYDTLDRFYFNLISLIIFSALMIFISYSGLRRQKYDSI